MNTSVWKKHTVADIFQSYFYSYYCSLKSILSKYTWPTTKLISICMDIIFWVGNSLPILGSYGTPSKVIEQFFYLYLRSTCVPTYGFRGFYQALSGSCWRARVVLERFHVRSFSPINLLLPDIYFVKPSRPIKFRQKTLSTRVFFCLILPLFLRKTNISFTCSHSEN